MIKVGVALLATLICLFNITTAFASISVDPPSNVASEIQITQSFSINSKLVGGQNGDVYFVKCRVGPSSSSLTEGQTSNSSTWLSDTASWTDMPTVTITSSSTSFSITCRVKSDASEGSKIIFTRACLKKSDGTCGTSFQSSSGVNFTATAAPSPTPSPTSSSSSFTISGAPSSIDSDKSFSVNVVLNLFDNPNTKFYLKGAFKKADSSNYFGLTKVGSSWVENGAEYQNQFSLTTDSSGSWSGSLDIEPDVMDSGYGGSGDYIFKVGRYTSSGSGPIWSSEVTIHINAKAVGDTSSNSDSPKTTSTTKTTQTYSKDTSLPEVVYSLENYRKISSSSASPTPSPTPSPEVKGTSSFNPTILLGGLFILAGVGSIIYIKYRSRYNN